MEVTYSGFLNPTNSADGTQDHDSDGIVNRDETLYGGLMNSANTDGDGNGNDGAERTAGTYVNSANDLPGYAVSGLLTVADPVDREGDRPSERYRMLVWDVEYPETIFIRHEPMQSFAGTTNESRAYNQFRPYRWYQTRIEPLARENATNALDLDYMAEVASGSAYFQVEKLDADLVLSSHEDCDTNWFTKSAQFRFVPRTVVDLDGVNSNGTEVADADEVEPGVKLVDGYTKLRIQDPWQGNPPGGDFGTFTLSWTNVPGKWIRLNGLDSPVTVDCASTGWPTNFTVTRSANWVDWLDSTLVTLSHSVATETDQVRLGWRADVQLVYQDQTPVGERTVVGGIEFVNGVPVFTNTTQQKLLYVKVDPYTPEVMGAFQGLVLRKNGMGVFGIDFAPDSTGLSKPILPLSPYYKDSALTGITNFHYVTATEGDVLAVRPWVTDSGDLDSVVVDLIRIPLSAKIVKGETSGVGSTRTVDDINGLLTGIDNMNQIWAQFGYSFYVTNVNESLVVPDSYVDGVYYQQSYLVEDAFAQDSPAMDLSVSPPRSFDDHTVWWRVFSGETNPTVAEVNAASSLEMELYRRVGVSTSLISTATCTSSVHDVTAVAISGVIASGTVYYADSTYETRFRIVSGSNTYHSPRFWIDVNEFRSLMMLDRNSAALNCYFVKRFDDPFMYGGAGGPYATIPPPGAPSPLKAIGLAVVDNLSGEGFDRITAHEVGHCLGQRMHVYNPTNSPTPARLMSEDAAGVGLRIKDVWNEYTNTYRFAEWYDDENE